MTYLPNHRIVAIAVATMIAVTASASSASGQRFFHRNGDGEWELRDLGQDAQRARKSEHQATTIGEAFTVTYQDVEEANGIGFDDADLGAARRQVLEAVLVYLGSVLDVRGVADLLVSNSQVDGSGPAAAGSPFFLPEVGFQGGLALAHLTTGVDPLPQSHDASIVVDFGYSWNTDMGPPSETQYDLFTALLHETIHVLGMLSAGGPDGASQLLNFEDRGLFTLMDALLVRASANRRLYLSEGQINATTEDVTSQNLVFSGPRARQAYGAFPSIFAPESFIEGSSMSHWDGAAVSEALLLPGLRLGDQRKELATWELQALADLGYSVIACGDGVVAGSEQCDDANQDDGDGCNRRCKVLADPALDAGVPDAGTDGDPDAVADLDASMDASSMQHARSHGSSTGCTAVARTGQSSWIEATWLALVLVLRAIRRGM